MWFFQKQKLYKKKAFYISTKAILIGTAVVLFWRGMWGMLDLYLFPHNLTLSYFFSLLAGILVLYATHYLVKGLLGD
ncbi:MAG TPA: hypothetical protein VF209_04750 [Patescibacteria group bacterium]